MQYSINYCENFPNKTWDFMHLLNDFYNVYILSISLKIETTEAANTM